LFFDLKELDDPSFTQPSMYKTIGERASIPSLYKESLVSENLIDENELVDELKAYRASLDDALASVLNGTYAIEPRNTYLTKQWSSMTRASGTHRTYWDTGCPIDLLKHVGLKSVCVPNEIVCVIFIRPFDK
jgi:probable 2-oxoglutarate dehydrogenase E1 component DHKTD1